MANAAKQTEPKPVGCTCDFSSGTRGMDRCGLCGGTGSRLLVAIDGQAFYFPNTKDGWSRAVAKLAEAS